MSNMWEQINDAIVAFILRTLLVLKFYYYSITLDLVTLLQTENFESKEHFFELMRFDFIKDADLNVYLIIINIHNTIKLVGLGNYTNALI